MYLINSDDLYKPAKSIYISDGINMTQTQAFDPCYIYSTVHGSDGKPINYGIDVI